MIQVDGIAPFTIAADLQCCFRIFVSLFFDFLFGALRELGVECALFFNPSYREATLARSDSDGKRYSPANRFASKGMFLTASSPISLGQGPKCGSLAKYFPVEMMKINMRGR